MQFDIVIPTIGNIQNILRILGAIDRQAVMPEHIFLIIDKHFANAEEREAFTIQACGVFSNNLTNRLVPVSMITHDFIVGKGASYARNYGIDLVTSEYVYLIDDDNTFDEKFFQRSINDYKSADLWDRIQRSHKRASLIQKKMSFMRQGITHQISKEKYDNAIGKINALKGQMSVKEILYSPTIIRRETEKIQSVGLRRFHYMLGRAEPMLGGWKTKIVGGLCGLFSKKKEDKYFYYPQMIGGNSLLGKTSIFKELRFDERMKFIYEDLDLTHRWYRTKGPIAVSKKNKIYHMERDKTALEKSFIGSIDTVYEKAKNLTIFVANNASFWQRVSFITSGLRVASSRFMLAIILRGKQKRKLLAALVKGMNQGAKAFKKK